MTTSAQSTHPTPGIPGPPGHPGHPGHPDSPAPSAGDSQLLARFVRGDRNALGELAARYERLLLGLAIGILGGDESKARDAVQQTWLNVIRKAAQFKARSSVKTWLYRIAINECRTLQRTQRIVLRPGGERDARDDDSLTDLRTAISQLDTEQREILLLCYHRDMTREQAAGVLDMPTGTLKTKLRAAKENLRARLEPEGNES